MNSDPTRQCTPAEHDALGGAGRGGPQGREGTRLETDLARALMMGIKTEEARALTRAHVGLGGDPGFEPLRAGPQHSAS